MISWKLITKCQPIGLDIGHDSVKMIQLAVNSGQRSVIAAEKVRIDQSLNTEGSARRDFTISAIKRMLADGGFRGRNVISCLPNDELKITSLRIAKTETVEIEQVLRKEVSERFGLDFDKDAINYVLAGDVWQGDELKNELILFAADSEKVKSHIELLEETGLNAVSIDTIPAALFRGFDQSQRRQGDKKRTAVFVDIGSNYTTVIFGRDGELSFVKQIPLGVGKFDQKLSAKLDIGIAEAESLRQRVRIAKLAGVGQTVPEGSSAQEASDEDGLDASIRQIVVDAVGSVSEELAREISLCFRYYTVTFRGKRLERAVFSGGGTYENILLNTFKRHLTVEVDAAEPLRGFDTKKVNFGSDRRSQLCEWAVAVGLGLKEV